MNTPQTKETEHRGCKIIADYGRIGSRSEGWGASYKLPNGETKRTHLDFFMTAEDAFEQARKAIDEYLSRPQIYVNIGVRLCFEEQVPKNTLARIRDAIEDVENEISLRAAKCEIRMTWMDRDGHIIEKGTIER